MFRKPGTLYVYEYRGHLGEVRQPEELAPSRGSTRNRELASDSRRLLEQLDIVTRYGRHPRSLQPAALSQPGSTT